MDTLGMVGCEFMFQESIPQKGGWATPRVSARLGQPVEQEKQASHHVPGDKN